MKSQCDIHGCAELLCGCSVYELEDNIINEMQTVIDKQNETLRFYGDNNNWLMKNNDGSYSTRAGVMLRQDMGLFFNTTSTFDSGKKAREVLADELVKKYEAGETVLVGCSGIDKFLQLEGCEIYEEPKKKTEQQDETFWVIEKDDLYLGVSCNQFHYMTSIENALKFTDSLTATELRNVLKLMFSSISGDFNNTLVTEHILNSEYDIDLDKMEGR